MNLNDQQLRQIPLTAFLAVAGILIPQIFHLFGLGSVFLPMFLPVMLGGLTLTWQFALLLAVISPVVSWLFTGMPPLIPPVLPMMIAELITVNAILSGLHVHLKRNLWAALIPAIIADRLLLFLIAMVIAPLLGWHQYMFSLALVASGIPGIIMQLTVLPFSLRLLHNRWMIQIEEQK